LNLFLFLKNMRVNINENCINCMACINASNGALIYDETKNKICLKKGVDPDERKGDLKSAAQICPVGAIELTEE
jgi:ferredoxin